MIKHLIALAIIAFLNCSIAAQNMQSSGKSAETESYTTQIFASAFEAEFKEKEDLKDVKKLRVFYRERTDLLYALKDQMRNYADYSYEATSMQTNLNALQEEIKDKKPTEIIELDASLVDRFYYVDRNQSSLTVKQIKVIISSMEQKKASLVKQIEAYKNLKANINNVKDDLDKCESQIDATLAPEYQQQEFRIWISVCFTALIAILLVTFFLIVYIKSDNTLSKDLLSSNGLQFITLFVLIIAIILFGILNILHGTELATILSGISGYILGKGISANTNPNANPNPIPNPSTTPTPVPNPIPDPNPAPNLPNPNLPDLKG